MDLKELQPYLTALSAGLSVATLGFLLNVVRTIRDNAQDRIAIQEERLKKAAEEQQRLEKWSDREKASLQHQLDKATKELNDLLKSQGIDLNTLALGKQISQSAVEVRSETQKLVEEMRAQLQGLAALTPEKELHLQSAAELSIAMGSMAAGKYQEAATHFDAYAARGSTSWEAHYSRGVAHANARGGDESNTAALMAYNDALALAPRDLEGNRWARLFCYRGAILKRLGRLDEAANDLTLSLKLATEEYERLDAHYNLACIYAMQRNRGQMLKHLRALEGRRRQRGAVSAHLHDYFQHFRDDPELQTFIAGKSLSAEEGVA